MSTLQERFIRLLDATTDYSSDKLMNLVDEIAFAERGLHCMGWLRVPLRWFDVMEAPEPLIKLHKSVPKKWLEEWTLRIRQWPDVDVLYGFTVPMTYTNSELRSRAHLTGGDEWTLEVQQRHGIWDTLICPVAGRFLFAYWSKKNIELDYSDRVILHLLAALVCHKVWAEQPVLEQFENPNLRPRELACLKCYSLGKDVNGTAEHLGLSQETVKEYLKNARRKLKARTTTQAVANALRMRLMP
jgi:LuxR family quorum sensing-dependent transcriptional regulator